MTLAELVNEVKRFGYGDDTEYDDDAITEVINIVNQELISMAAWPFTEEGPTNVTINNGDYSADAPADFNKSRALFINGSKLAKCDIDEFIQLNATNETGTPTTYCIQGSETILLYPTPDDGFTGKLWYHKNTPELVDNTDEPEFPERHHRILVYAAVLWMDKATDRPDRAMLQEQYDARLALMKSDLMEKDVDRLESFGDQGTALSIMKEVRQHGFTDLGDSLLLSWINDEITEIAALDAWPWLEKGPTNLSISADNALVTLPADCARPIKITLDEAVLERVTMRQLVDDNEGFVLTDTGTPEYYSMWTTSSGVPQIQLFPTPTSAATAKIWYVKTPSELTQVTDSLPFPARHSRVVTLGVLIRAAMHTSDEILSAKIEIFKAEHDRKLELMFNDLMKRQHDNRDKVHDSVIPTADWRR